MISPGIYDDISILTASSVTYHERAGTRTMVILNDNVRGLQIQEISGALSHVPDAFTMSIFMKAIVIISNNRAKTDCFSTGIGRRSVNKNHAPKLEYAN